jgi:hypothetical protein
MGLDDAVLLVVVVGAPGGVTDVGDDVIGVQEDSIHKMLAPFGSTAVLDRAQRGAEAAAGAANRP